ncbi:Nif11-like leader peptide family RiPP precursor [Lachnospiraceae bacterium C1.1]|nr:Nif11-like leader peptide family RiPP precursor [Lachnospiraceae bacterium C1.1]MDN4745374.1 Nif11-like leader peptide family RiPP precursor [Lachnospiraceae bacterium C1.1]
MAKEAASKFVQAILNDEELRQRTEKMKPEDAVPLGKEMGYDFTLEEFTDVMNEDRELYRELSPDELEAVAGGDSKTRYSMGWYASGLGYNKKYQNSDASHKNKANFCNGDPNGPRHQFVLSIEDRAQFFGAWTNTYAVYKCSLCNYKTEIHIKFGEGGEIIRVD